MLMPKDYGSNVNHTDVLWMRSLQIKDQKQGRGSYHIFASVARFNRQEKNEAFIKNNGDKTTNSIPSQKEDHVGSFQNKRSYASSLNGDRDSKVEKQVTTVKGNTLSNVPLTPSLITPDLVLDNSCENDHKGVDLNTETDYLWFIRSDSAGSSGGILCIWEATIFKKDYATVFDNFIAIYETWISNNSKFKKKLQDLKKIICSWIKDKKLQQSGAINSIKEDLIDIDNNLDSGNVSDEISLKRMELTRQLHDINQMKARDYVQKSKIKWAIEGDKNLKFFHVPKGVLKEMEAIRCNFFNGSDPTERKITWVFWDKVLASKKNGSLRVSSFYALNRALLLKWVWHFLSQDGTLWYRVIQALYGASFKLHPVNQSSIWCSILREMQVLICKGFDFVSYCKKRVRDGSVTLSTFKDRWICDLNDNGVFCVKEVRTILDDIFLYSVANATRWVKYIPIKINVFAWPVRLDRLPTRSNLVRRGVVLDSSLCSLCGLIPEDIHHVLFRCDTAKLVFHMICH
nr:RNA-directed DNA polymerase, eukaryota, reverse transcriptase zinc-binding domain protein [Tanacetum cinerariifolium]